jgi:hypothetical protein
MLASKKKANTSHGYSQVAICSAVLAYRNQIFKLEKTAFIYGKIYESRYVIAGAVRISDSMPQLRRFSKRGPRFDATSGHVEFVMAKWHCDRLSPNTSGSPSNSHSRNCSTSIIHDITRRRMV